MKKNHDYLKLKEKDAFNHIMEDIAGRMSLRSSRIYPGFMERYDKATGDMCGLKDKQLSNYAQKMRKQFERILWQFSLLDDNIANSLKPDISMEDLVDFLFIIYFHPDLSALPERTQDDDDNDPYAAVSVFTSPFYHIRHRLEAFIKTSGFVFERAVKFDMDLPVLTGIEIKHRTLWRQRQGAVFLDFINNHLFSIALRDGKIVDNLNAYLPPDDKASEDLLFAYLEFYQKSLSVYYGTFDFIADTKRLVDNEAKNGPAEEQELSGKEPEAESCQAHAEPPERGGEGELSLLRQMAQESADALTECDKEITSLKEALAKAVREKNTAVLEEQRNAAKWQKKYETLKAKTQQAPATEEGNEDSVTDNSRNDMAVAPATPDQNGVYSYKNILIVGDENGRTSPAA